MKFLTIKEHRKFDNEIIEKIIRPLNLQFSSSKDEIKYLNLSSHFETSYFIGAEWLLENEIALIVEPKIENIDYLKMFMECFNNRDISKELKNIYEIYFEKPAIKIPSNCFEITPFLIIHFLSVIHEIVKKGLKKDFIKIENNLNSKIKGKILFNINLKTNTFKGRFDKNYCRYQEYSIDCVENRILKKALNFVGQFLKTHFSKEQNLLNNFNYCFSAFSEIDDNIEINTIKSYKINKLYKEYAEALKLAKMILKRFSYSINQTQKLADENIPPFYIDMSLLFELFVYSKLKKEFGTTIKYQEKGSYGNTDILKIDDKLVIDAKYKTKYSNEYSIDDIRQLSGYARDTEILKKLKVDDNEKVIDCLIIFPSTEFPDNFSDRNLKQIPISQFINFYKRGIKLPIKNK